MAYDATAVANEFIRLAESEGRRVSPMQVQKLVYFAHGWYLALVGKPLINEFVEAWQYGPVIPSIYHEFKRYGSGPITSKAFDDFFCPPDFRMGFKEARIDDYPDREENELAKRLIRRVWEVYKKFSPIQLSNMTHSPDTPWRNAFDPGLRNKDIPNESISEFFKRLARKHEQST